MATNSVKAVNRKMSNVTKKPCYIHNLSTDQNNKSATITKDVQTNKLAQYASQ